MAPLVLGKDYGFAQSSHSSWNMAHGSDVSGEAEHSHKCRNSGMKTDVKTWWPQWETLSFQASAVQRCTVSWEDESHKNLNDSLRRLYRRCWERSEVGQAHSIKNNKNIISFTGNTKSLLWFFLVDRLHHQLSAVPAPTQTATISLKRPKTFSVMLLRNLPNLIKKKKIGLFIAGPEEVNGAESFSR